MLRSNGSILEQLVCFDRPIPAILATRLFAPRARPALDLSQCRSWNQGLSRRALCTSPVRPLARSRETEREEVRNQEKAQSFTGNYPWPAGQGGDAAPTEDLFEAEEAQSIAFEASARDNHDREIQPLIPRYSADSDSLFEDEIITPISKSRQRRLKKRAEQRELHLEKEHHDSSPIVRRTEGQTPSQGPRSLKAWEVALRDRKSSPETSTSNFQIPTAQEVATWVDDLDLDNAPERSAGKYWDGFAYDERARRWPCLMLHYLERSPDHALRFIRHIVTSYEPPVQHIAEVFGRIANVMVHESDTGDPGIPLWDTLQFTVEAMSNSAPLTQKTIYAALRGLHAQKLYSAMDWLAFNDYHVSLSVLHLLTRSLAANGNIHDALVFFKEIVDAFGRRKDSTLDDTAVRIVLCAIGDSGDYNNGLQAVQSIVRLKTGLARPTFRVLLVKAIEAGDVRGAWELFMKLMRLVRVPDDEIYGMMMNMSRKVGDRGGYKTLYMRLKPEIRRFLEPNLIAEIMQCRHAFNSRDNFDHILSFYERHCNVRPLRVLGVVPSTYISRFVHFYPQPRPDPGPLALSVILRKFITAQYAAQPAIRVYIRFLHALRERDPELMELAANEQIWQAFIKAFGNENAFVYAPSRKYGQRYCPIYWENILHRMTTWIATASDSGVRDTTSRSSRKPSQVTWNIVLNAHARKGKLSLVDSVINRMRRNGLEPDIVTWNSLLSSFARFQHVHLVAAVLRRMKSNNVPFNGETTKALGLVWDRAGLAQAMKAIGDEVDTTLGDSVSYQSFSQLKARVMALGEHIGGAGGRQHWRRVAALYRLGRPHGVDLRREKMKATWRRIPPSGSQSSLFEEAEG